MASPPFLPDETKPADSDIVSQFPAVERAFRDIIETWLLVDHTTDGEHTQVTLPESAGDPSNATDIGFLYTKNDGGDTELFYEDAGGNVVQITVGGALFSFPATTSMFFYQSAAPTGWTKDTNATLGNHALKLVTDIAWSGGSKGATAFDSVFGSSKVTGAHALSTAEMPSHTHTVNVGNTGGAGLTGSSFQVHQTGFSGATAAATGGGGTHTHTLSLDLNHIQVIRATKD